MKAVRICPDIDAACGDREINWCEECPKRKSKQAQPVEKHADNAYLLADKVREALDREACPDAFMRIAYESIIKNYTAPPQCKPLTLEDLAEALNVDYLENQQIKDARAIEAAHGIKE